MSIYRDFLHADVGDFLRKDERPVPGIPGLTHVGDIGGLETTDALRFLVDLARRTGPALERILKQRQADRDFIDQRTRALTQFNREQGYDVTDLRYRTVMGLADAEGRTVVGPLRPDYARPSTGTPVAPLPEHLKGPHVTLFGPPDSAKMCINAVNAYHRKLKDEPPVVAELLATSTALPKWGADDEDSKTPLRADLVSAGENLSACFDGELRYVEASTGRVYELQATHRSLPIKRFPGLALPCPFLFLDGEPLPLHLYDFALHLFRHWNRPEALTFYVPKLENEEDARYVRHMIETAEDLLSSLQRTYVRGSVRLMIVLENPRAVFRVHEIIDELHPYFAGASLGWHDFLASTARLFKEDPNYRIPVKADPDIVIKYIKASHELLARVVGPRGGIKIGGMYGLLPLTNDLKSESFQVTIKGYIRDVVTQMKRELDGFWVAHPDFVRLGLALVEAWTQHRHGRSENLDRLVNELLEPQHRREILDFIHGPDIAGLDPEHDRYARALIVADLQGSQIIQNNDPEEIRYNVFQSLQYLADWLSGNGCVALPTHVGATAVRIMDDMATAERSRWEVWHELHHGRFAIEDFLRIAFEEMHFIRKDLSDAKKIVQVKYDERTARWYPLAFKLMLQLMTSDRPVEFVTELLLPLTMDSVRNAEDPWALLNELAPEKYHLSPLVERYCHYFEACGHGGWARALAQRVGARTDEARALMMAFTRDDINEAARFHGNIGEGARTLDKQASAEQARVLAEGDTVRQQLLNDGEAYRQKFGMKFLVSAKGRSANDLLAHLRERMHNTPERELANAREALWEITRKRLEAGPPSFYDRVNALRDLHGVHDAQIAMSEGGSAVETMVFGAAQPSTPFEIASLSKSFAAAFALEFFRDRNIELTTSVDALLAKTTEAFRVGDPRVTIEHLLKHEALNMHYVQGIPAGEALPPLDHWLKDVRVESGEPGTQFRYSGGGFLVLETLITALAGRSAPALADEGLRRRGLTHATFNPQAACTKGYTDDGHAIPSGHKMFPSFAAGMLSPASDVAMFLQQLSSAHARGDDQAVVQLRGTDKGAVDFMGARMGLGIFTAEAGLNRIALHQGANDGFRALFLWCYQGPQAGRGFVALANGELKAVRFISAFAQLWLREFGIEGVDASKLGTVFDPSALKPEEVVNRGYKDLVFRAFEPRRPRPIPRRGPVDALAPYNRVVGARVLSVTNQIFALAENLISDREPAFEVDLYEPQGKVMDSWESGRHNPAPTHDLELELVKPCAPKYVALSTAYHNGNQVPAVSLEGFRNGHWTEFLPCTALDAHAVRKITLPDDLPEFTRVRVKTYPDGGFTRLGLYDKTLPALERETFDGRSRPWPHVIPQPKKPLTLPFVVDAKAARLALDALPAGAEFNNASPLFGATVLECSNEHYSPASQVLSPLPALHMFDGFESARSREPGHTEYAVIALAAPRSIHRLEFDFTHFVNNNPRALAVAVFQNGQWVNVVEPTDVKGHAGLTKTFHLKPTAVTDRVRVTVIPDGGINRLRVFSNK